MYKTLGPIQKAKKGTSVLLVAATTQKYILYDCKQTNIYITYLLQDLLL